MKQLIVIKHTKYTIKLKWAKIGKTLLLKEKYCQDRSI